MTRQILMRPGPGMSSAILTGATIHVAFLLCWAGIIPVWKLAPQPLQSSLQAALATLLWPALAMAGGVILVAMLRIAGMRGRIARVAYTVLNVAGIAFAIVALGAVSGISFAGYGPGWMMLGWMISVGAIVARVILPWVAVIVVIAGLLSLLRPVRAA
jgi:hypothetical protein